MVASRVRIADDYREPLDKQTGRPLPIPISDVMLAYVSVTRAMDTLDVGGLGWVHDHLAALDTPPTPSAPAAAPDPAKAPEPPAQASVPFGVKVGDEVLVAGEHGTFKVTVVFRDGSYEAYATNGAGGARSFQPEWCTPAWKQSSRSASGRVRVRQVPASARQARADWQGRHRPGADRIEEEIPTPAGPNLVLGP